MPSSRMQRAREAQLRRLAMVQAGEEQQQAGRAEEEAFWNSTSPEYKAAALQSGRGAPMWIIERERAAQAQGAMGGQAQQGPFNARGQYGLAVGNIHKPNADWEAPLKGPASDPAVGTTTYGGPVGPTVMGIPVGGPTGGGPSVPSTPGFNPNPGGPTGPSGPPGGNQPQQPVVPATQNPLPELTDEPIPGANPNTRPGGLSVGTPTPTKGPASRKSNSTGSQSRSNLFYFK